MRLRRPHRRHAGETVIPLVNIVLLLLVYFILAGRLADPQPFAVDPPASVTGDPAGPEHLVVLVGRDGRLALDGRPTDLDALGDAVARRLEGAPSGPVIVRADAAAEAATVIAVLGVLQSAGAGSLRVIARAGPP